MKYYIINYNDKNGLVEVSKEEYDNLIGQLPISEYANQVYHGTLSVGEVPEEFRVKVAEIVANKIAQWGKYEDRDIPDSEALNIITGGND